MLQTGILLIFFYIVTLITSVNIKNKLHNLPKHSMLYAWLISFDLLNEEKNDFFYQLLNDYIII